MKDYFNDSKIILGMMRLNNLTPDDLEKVIRGALDMDIHYFDLSDVYGRHTAEEKFGEVMRRHPEWRKEMFIQTKCGILKNEGEAITHMDLSYEHIKQACYDSMKRMNLDYLDCFLLHRVDIFMDAKEVNRAFKELKEEGKVLHFGVSNMDVQIMEYLKAEVEEPILLNQLQLGLGQTSLVSQTFNVNAPDQVPNLQDGLFFYLKRNHMKLQCWSPLIYGFFKGSIFSVPEMENTRICLDKMAKKYNTTPSAIAIAFDACLGDFVQVVIGSMNLDHIRDSLEGSKIKLSREDWYELYLSTGNLLP